MKFGENWPRTLAKSFKIFMTLLYIKSEIRTLLPEKNRLKAIKGSSDLKTVTGLSSFQSSERINT